MKESGVPVTAGFTGDEGIGLFLARMAGSAENDWGAIVIGVGGDATSGGLVGDRAFLAGDTGEGIKDV